MPQTMQTKDPDEIKDYKIAWGTRLDSGDTPNTSTWNVDSDAYHAVNNPTGIKVGDGTNGAPEPSISGTDCIVWLIGGTAGAKAKIRNKIVTTPGARTHEDSIYVPIGNK